MNREDIIRMAREASNTPIDHHATPDLFGINQIERFAALIASAERKRILDICKEGWWDSEGIRYHLDKQERGQA